MLKRLLFLLFISVGTLFLLPTESYSQSTINRAGVVIDFGNGQTHTQCVSFSEEQISGYELLQRSGFPLELDVNGGVGAAVCSINGVGCPGSNCFCQCPGGSNCVYWSYWLLQSGNWLYSAVGASNRPIRNGDVDGWVWGPGSFSDASPPISTSFEQICPAQTVPTDTPTPVNTATPLPTYTSTPSQTPTSVTVATNTATPTTTSTPTINFSATLYSIVTGSCTELQWDVQNVTAVFLDNNGVGGQDQLTVCPTQTQSYQLRAVFATGEQTETVTIEVTESTATPTVSISTPTIVTQIGQMAPAATNTTTPTATPTETQPTIMSIVEQTPSATAPAQPTAEMIMVQVPLAPTTILLPTLLPTPIEIAAVREVDITQETSTPPSPLATAEPPFDWLGYSVFFTLVTSLTITLVIIRHRQ